MHILHSNIANPAFYKAYIANALINLQELSYIFYKKIFILKY